MANLVSLLAAFDLKQSGLEASTFGGALEQGCSEQIDVIKASAGRSWGQATGLDNDFLLSVLLIFLETLSTYDFL